MAELSEKAPHNEQSCAPLAPTGNWWFWAVQLFPAVAANSGTAETREAAMDAFKAQWMQRRGWEHPWIRRT